MEKKKHKIIEILEEKSSSSLWKRERYLKGAAIHPGEEALKKLILLRSGTIAGVLLSETGKIMTVERIEGPDIIAPALVFSSNPGPVSIQSVTDTETVSIPRIEFLAMLRKEPELLEFFLQFLADKFILVSHKLMFHGFHTIRKKLALYLLELDRFEDHIFELPVNLTELSEYLGVERPSLSNVFNQLIKENIIERKGRKITLLKPDTLQNILQ